MTGESIACMACVRLAGAGLVPMHDSSHEDEHCARCGRQFVPEDTTYAGWAQYRTSPFCRACVDVCHDSESADHRCAVCTSACWGRPDGAPVVAGSVIVDGHLEERTS